MAPKPNPAGMSRHRLDGPPTDHDEIRDGRPGRRGDRAHQPEPRPVLARASGRRQSGSAGLPP